MVYDSKRSRRKSLTIVTTTDPREKNIYNLILSLKKLKGKEDFDLEILIVDDLKLWGSPKEIPRFISGVEVKVIWNSESVGQLEAITSGMMVASTDIVLTIDPDMHQFVDRITDMMHNLDGHTRIVHAVRSHRPNIPLIRKIGSFLINKIARTVGGINIADIGSSMVLVDKKTMTDLKKAPSGINKKLYLYKKHQKNIKTINLVEMERTRFTSQYSLTMLIKLFYSTTVELIRIRLRDSYKEK